MRDVTAQFLRLITESHQIETRITWKPSPDSPIVVEVPITQGAVTFDATAAAVRRCTLTVPMVDDQGNVWDPTNDPSAPLSVYGNRLQIETGIRYSPDEREIVSLGYFLITDVELDYSQGEVLVTGSCLWQLLEDCPIVRNPNDFLGANRYFSDVAELLTWAAPTAPLPSNVQILTPTFESSLPRKFCPPGFIDVREKTDRIGQMRVLADAWPAQVAVNDLGRVHWINPVTGPKATPDIVLHADKTQRASLMGRGAKSSREDFANAVYVNGLDPETSEVIATASALRVTGPLAYNTQFGLKPRWYESTDISDDNEARVVANALLGRYTLNSRTEDVTIVPNPAIELWDTAQVSVDGGTAFTGLVTGYTVPLTADGGGMSVTISRDVGE